MSTPEELDGHALRTSAGHLVAAHVSLLRVTGPGALAALDRVCTSDVATVPNQIIATLMLDERGYPLADVWLTRVDEAFILWVEGQDFETLAGHIRAHSPESAPGLKIEDLSITHRAHAIHGPYAWAVATGLHGEDVLATPLMTAFKFDEGICLRTGRIGEYGYDFVIERSAEAQWLERVAAQGSRIELRPVELGAFDRCVIENGGFCIRVDLIKQLNPLELQLQWRVRWEKSFVGAEALAAAKTAGIPRRITWCAVPQEVQAGDPIFHGETKIGVLTTVVHCKHRNDWVGIATLDIGYAHAGLSGFEVRRLRKPPVPLRTVAPPLINNRSLHVDPTFHTYESRSDHSFPALSPESPQ